MTRHMTTLLTSAALLALAACGDSDGTMPADAGSPAPATHGDVPASTASPEEVQIILSGLGEPYASANLDNGRRLFRRCASCHTLGDGERHLVGPNLHGMFGRQVGGAQGFRFSRALEEAEFVWTKAELDDWLANPRTYLPGNRMSFVGLRNESDRVDLIAFLAVETAR